MTPRQVVTHVMGKLEPFVETLEPPVRGAEWLADKKNGLGAETYSDDSKYKGQFNNGLRHGV